MKIKITKSLRNITVTFELMCSISNKQGQKCPLDTPKRMIEKREREKGRRRDIEREGEKRDREVKGIERVKGRVKSSLNLPNREINCKERLITKIMTR